MSIIKANEIQTLDGTVVYKKGETIANDSVEYLSQLLNVNPNAKAVVNVLNYHNGLEGGGGVFYWDADKAKSAHNGGTVIDPLATFPTDWNDQTLLGNWFDTSNTGTGCWVRQYDGAVSTKWFGTKGKDATIVTRVLNNNIFNEVYLDTVTLEDTVTIDGRNTPLVIKGSVSFDVNYSDSVNHEMFKVLVADVTVEDMSVTWGIESSGTNNNSCFWVDAGADSVNFLKCKFTGIRGGGSNFNGAIAYLADCNHGLVQNCTFRECPGAVFTKGRGTIINGNTAWQPKDVSFALNGQTSTDCVISNNSVVSIDNSCSIHIGIEEGAQQFTVTGNTIRGVKDGIGIGCITVASTPGGVGGIITGNFVDGNNETTTNPCALISVGPNYSDIIVTGNIMQNAPTGNSNTASLLLNGGVKASNNIVKTNSGNYGILVAPSGQKNISIFDTFVHNTSTTYSLYLANNNGGGATVSISGVEFTGNPAEAMSLNNGNNVNVEFKDLTYKLTSGAKINLNSTINRYFNEYNTHIFPHRYASRKTLYGNSIPTSDSWQQGDTVYTSAPTAGGAIGWVCVIPGTPGIWKSFGNVSA
jgi:hypothetical protein